MKSLIGITTILTISLSAQAQNFDQLLNSVLSNNQAVASSRYANESELLNLKSENNLPDPEVEVEYQWGRHEVGDKFDINVSQGFDWPGVYRARGKAIATASRAMEFLDRSNYIDKKLELKLLFIDIINARKNIALLKSRIGIMDELIDKYTHGQERGELTILDINKIKIERAKLNNSLSSIESDYEMLCSTLVGENGGKECNSLIEQLNEYPDDMILPVDNYEKMLTENNPMNNYSSLMSQSQAQMVQAEKLSRLPGFTLGYHHSWEDGDVFNGLVVGMTLPFFSTRHKVKAAKAMQQSLAYQEESVASQLHATMMGNRNKVLSLHRQLDSYGKALGNDDNARLLKMALDGGEISILDYLGEMAYFLEARQDYLDLQYRYNQALAELNKYTLVTE